jgi:DNA-binding transcriptional MocR family regulator
LLLSEPGDIAWIEDPGYAGAKSAFAKTGLTMVGMPVDDEGMCWEGQHSDAPSLIFTSPSHQFPYGSVLSARRRLALLELAQAQKAWIVEDDYDSEFRYTGEPVPAMSGMIKHAPVVYLGTFSKTLFPSLRIGLWCYRLRWQRRLNRQLAHCCVVGIARNSAHWRCLLKRGIMRDTLRRCVDFIVNGTGSYVRH